jgi:large subunit ribosomal protein L21
MYAIIETGGKQYRVEEGDVLDVELLSSQQTVAFSSVLFFHDGTNSHLGLPHVPKCVVHAEVLGEVKGPKVIAFKFKPCKRFRRTVGHRQRYSRLKITKIEENHGN